MEKTSQSEFYQRAEEFIYSMIEENPVGGTQLGDHRFDDRLADHSKANLERNHRRIKEGLSEIEGLDTADFDLDAKIDQRLMVQIARSMVRDFEHVRMQGHRRNPGTYANECLGGVFLLLVKEFAPLEARLEKVLGRLKAIPQVLAQGKENIEPAAVPPVWNEVAIESAEQGLALFTMLIPALAGQAPKIQAELNEASSKAAEALQDWVNFLKERVSPQAQGDFAIDQDLFEELLREDHQLDYTAEELLQTGWRLFEETKEQMEKVAREIDPTKSVKELMEEAKADHPGADELMDAYKKEMAGVRQFVIDHDIATIPAGELLKIEPTPPFLRGVMPYAAYMPPGPLEEQ